MDDKYKIRCNVIKQVLTGTAMYAEDAEVTYGGIPSDDEFFGAEADHDFAAEDDHDIAPSTQEDAWQDLHEESKAAGEGSSSRPGIRLRRQGSFRHGQHGGHFHQNDRYHQPHAIPLPAGHPEPQEREQRDSSSNKNGENEAGENKAADAKDPLPGQGGSQGGESQAQQEQHP
jgi:hypothetical protein